MRHLDSLGYSLQGRPAFMGQGQSVIRVESAVAKGASTPSNIASNIAGNCVVDPSTLSKFPATRSKIAGNTGIHT